MTQKTKLLIALLTLCLSGYAIAGSCGGCGGGHDDDKSDKGDQSESSGS